MFYIEFLICLATNALHNVCFFKLYIFCFYCFMLTQPLDLEHMCDVQRG